jgi:hypothetical protein
MARTGWFGRLFVLLLAIVAVVAVFLAVVRPWYLTWGASADERMRLLPGDDIVPGTASQQTRAITIEAPAAAIWPWLAQTGQDRGGFYSFDLLENLVGCEMPTTDVLRAEAQRWTVGDKLWMYPPDKAGGMGFATLRVYEPGRAMGFGTRIVGTPLEAPENGSWSFILEPIDPDTTRLLIRGRGEPRRSLLGTAFDAGVFEPIHFMMERRMMIGLKQLAETGTRRRELNNIHIAYFVIAGTLALISALFVLLRRRWQMPLVAFLASAAVFQILTLGQPPLLLGLLLVVANAALVGRSGRRGVAMSRAAAVGLSR